LTPDGDDEDEGELNSLTVQPVGDVHVEAGLEVHFRKLTFITEENVFCLESLTRSSPSLTPFVLILFVLGKIFLWQKEESHGSQLSAGVGLMKQRPYL